MTEIEELKVELVLRNECIMELERMNSELIRRNERQAEMLKDYDKTLNALQHKMTI